MASSRLLALSLFTLISRASDIPIVGDGYVSYSVQNVDLSGTLKPVKRQDSVPISDPFTGTSYFINLSIGSNAQPVTVLLDTGSSELWVNPTCSTVLSAANLAYCNSLPRYNAQTSSTSKNLGTPFVIHYGKGDTQGTYYTDDFKIGTGALKNQQFGVASRSVDIPAGILGVGPHTPSFNYPSVVENLAAQGQIHSVAFGLDLHDATSPGTIIFGGLDSKKYQCSLQKLNILPPAQVPDGQPRYMVTLTDASQSVPSQAEKTYNIGTNGFPVLLDSGGTLSRLPPTLVSAIAQDYPSARFDSASGFYIVPCNAPAGSVNFKFGAKTVKVPYADFIWRVPSTTQCVLGMLPEASSPPLYVLGDSFLRAAYVVFDLDNQNIWIDQADDCGTNVIAIGKGASAVPQVSGCHCGTNGTTPTNSTKPSGPSSPSANSTAPGVHPSPTIKAFEGAATTPGAGWIVSLMSFVVLLLALE